MTCLKIKSKKQNKTPTLTLEWVIVKFICLPHFLVLSNTFHWPYKEIRISWQLGKRGSALHLHRISVCFKIKFQLQLHSEKKYSSIRDYFGGEIHLFLSSQIFKRNKTSVNNSTDIHPHVLLSHPLY